MSNFFDFNKSFGPVDEESELIPLMTSDDEEAILKETLPKSIPIPVSYTHLTLPTNVQV